MVSILGRRFLENLQGEGLDFGARFFYRQTLELSDFWELSNDGCGVVDKGLGDVVTFAIDKLGGHVLGFFSDALERYPLEFNRIFPPRLAFDGDATILVSADGFLNGCGTNAEGFFGISF